MSIPELSFLNRIVAKDLVLKTNPPTTEELATRFHDSVRSSRGFAWMGVVAGQGEAEVYLSERDGVELTEQVREAAVDAIELFDDLTLSLEHHPLSINLNLVRISECSTEELQHRLQEKCNNNPEFSLVYEEAFTI